MIVPGGLAKKGRNNVVALRFLPILLLIALFMALIPALVSSADSTVIAEDFSAYPAGPLVIGSGNNWTREGTAPVMNIVKDPATGLSYAAITHDLTGSSYLGQRFAAQAGGLIFEFEVNIPGSSGGNLFMCNGKVNATTSSALRYTLSGGVFKRYGSSTPLLAYDPAHWYRFKYIFNIPQRTYTLTILDLSTGNAVSSVESFYLTTVDRISSFSFAVNAGGGKISLTNLRLTELDLALSDLQLDAGGFVPSLVPAFDPGVAEYTTEVPYFVNTLAITPTANYPAGVAVKVGDTEVSGGGSVAVALSGDTTSIAITVASSVYPDIRRTYTVTVNRLERSPNPNNVTAEGREAKVLIGWEEPIDPTYQETRVYQVNPADNTLTLVDTVPKGGFISTVAGLVNGTPYTFVVKGAYADSTESSGVTVSATPVILPARQMESLDRGLVAMRKGGGIYLGWRLLGTDPAGISFNLYRDGVRINPSPISGSTNYLDPEGAMNSSYSVRAVLDGVEQIQTEAVRVWETNYLTIPLRKPADGVTLTGEAYTYWANDAGVGDLDGDGQYEIVLKWQPSNAKDNSIGGYTGNTYVDAYRLDGTFMWRIDCGRNIRSGAHYLHVMVYDLDGDGQAEVAMRTADGTIDGTGIVIGDANADYRNASGYVLTGPEYFTIFEGATGRALATEAYEPPRGTVGDWGDTYGNRVDRFLACIAYLDGRRPSLVMQRGYYTRMVLVAYDWRDGRLTKRWTFDSNAEGNSSYAGQGNHQLSVADVDGDGRDEIITGPAAIDDDGQGLWNTRLGHGDAMHLGDLDPDRLGLEEFAVQEDTGGRYSADLKDARTGRVLWGLWQTGFDTGRGLTADIDPRYKGEEAWAVTGDWNSPVGRLFSAKGQEISRNIPSANFAIWWDGDLGRELLDHQWLGDPLRVGIPKIDKWDYEDSRLVNIVTFDGTYSNNDTKGNPCLQADILGDWREEVILRTEDSTALRIYSTTALTDHRLHTLMHDPLYRLGVAWQNNGYNQPPHTGFYLGEGMAAPPRPNIYTIPLMTGLSSNAATSGTIGLVWPAIDGVESYNIYRSVSAMEGFSVIGNAVGPAYEDGGLSPDSIYYYRVAAVKGGAEWCQSTVLRVKTIALPLPALSGTKGTGGWYVSAVTAALAANDDPRVAARQYSLDGADWLVYDSPVAITDEGYITLSLRAVDRGGHVLAVYDAEIKIDKTAPAVKIISPAASTYKTADLLTIYYSVSETLSGLASSRAALNGTAVANGQRVNLASMAGKNELTVSAKDKAGNTASASIEFEVVISAAVAIKPDTLPLRSHGGNSSVTAYIRFPAGYKVSLVDISTVKMSVNGKTIHAQLCPLKIEDGLLMVKFDRQKILKALAGKCGEVKVIVTGILRDGRSFSGGDSIRVIK